MFTKALDRTQKPIITATSEFEGLSKNSNPNRKLSWIFFFKSQIKANYTNTLRENWGIIFDLAKAKIHHHQTIY